MKGASSYKKLSISSNGTAVQGLGALDGSKMAFVDLANDPQSAEGPDQEGITIRGISGDIGSNLKSEIV